MQKTGIVVPCYNEEQRLDVPRFLDFARTADDVRFLFVDDGSRDGTWDVLGRLVDAAPTTFTRLQLPANRGKAEAVRTGLARLMAEGHAYVGFWDADLATPLGDIPQFRAVLDERHDIQWVFGARVQLLGRRIERQQLRHYLGRIFATATSLVLAMPIYDTQCGAKLFRATPALAEVLGRPFDSRWIFEVEMIARLLALDPGIGFSPRRGIYEYPLMAWHDVRGSKVKSSDFPRAALELLNIWRRYQPASRHAIHRAPAERVLA